MEKAIVIGTVTVKLVFESASCGIDSSLRHVVLGSLEYDVYNKVSCGIVLKNIHLETTAGENAAENLLNGMQSGDMFLLRKYVRGWGINFGAEWSYWINGVEISCIVDSQELAGFLKNSQCGVHEYYVNANILG